MLSKCPKSALAYNAQVSAPVHHGFVASRRLEVRRPIRIENHQGLFAEPEWYQVLEEILKEDFIGFLPGSPVDVISVTGMPPICNMTCLAFKSPKTHELQKNPTYS